MPLILISKSVEIKQRIKGNQDRIHNWQNYTRSSYLRIRILGNCNWQNEIEVQRRTKTFLYFRNTTLSCPGLVLKPVEQFDGRCGTNRSEAFTFIVEAGNRIDRDPCQIFRRRYYSRARPFIEESETKKIQKREEKVKKEGRRSLYFFIVAWGIRARIGSVHTECPNVIIQIGYPRAFARGIGGRRYDLFAAQ